MQIKPLNVGGVRLDGNLLLAPLAGYTDFAFRAICCELGASLAFTEMVSCKGLMYNNENTSVLLTVSDGERVKAAQIFGNDPSIMRSACESEHLAPFDIIDINMGCPVPKLFKNGEGSALLEDIALAERIISECKKSGKVITVKFRTGVTPDRLVTEEFARMCEGAGASMITIHGRPRTAYYAGDVNTAEIAKAKNAVKIPVIANGGVFSREDADALVSATGCDGVMVARGALYNPFIFSEISGKTQVFGYKELIFKNVDGLKKIHPDRWIAHNMRKQIACYLKGVKGGKQAKIKLLSCESTDELKSVVSEVFDR
jgi:nifR3 family TIM-barrel protein